MSRIVEQRVTEMVFDNKLFEQGVNQSLKTISKLKEALNMPGVSKGMEVVTSTAEKMKTGLGGALESIKGNFGALEIAAGVALGNIATTAISAGTQLVKSFTLDPIIDGFREYETQLNSVQTILANTQSKGSTLDDVNSALNELNKYADLTIYNFTEMTRNIGTFTAAGVDLQTSVDSIKGIANLAAVSGSSSQQAATAMYQLSQALAAGKVQLQDWNSVVNAGMGGELFQNALMRTARNLGTGVDAALEKYGTFRESLTKGGWLTAEVLTETLKQISGAYSEADLIAKGYSESQAKEIVQLANTATDAATKVKTFTQLMDTLKEAVGSGWTQTWLLIMGDFEEAKEMWTGISDVLTGFIGKVSDARNNMLQVWKDLGGRTALLEGLKNIVTGLYNLISPFTKAMGSIIPKMTGEKLYALTEGFRKLTEFFRVSEETSKNLTTVLKFLVSPIKLLVAAVGGLIGVMVKLTTIALKPVITLAQSITVTIIKMVASIINFIYAIGDAIKNSTIVVKILEGIDKYIRPIIESIVGFLSNGYNKIVDSLYGIREIGKDDIMSFLSIIKKQLEPLGFIADFLKENIDKLISILGPIAVELKSRFDELSQNIKDGIKNFDYNKIGEYTDKFKMKFQEFIEYLKQAAAILKERSVFEIVGEYLYDKFGPSIEKVSSYTAKAITILKGAFSQVKDIAIDKFEYIVDKFKYTSDKLSNVGTHINNGIKTFAGLLKSAKDSIKDSADGFRDAIDTVADTIDPDKFMQFIGGGALIGVIWKLKSAFDGFIDLIKGKELNNSIIDVLNSLSDTLEAYQKNIKADRIVKIAASIGILAGALLLVAQVDSEKLVPAVAAMGAIMLELAALVKAFDLISTSLSVGSMTKTVVAMLGMSVALLLLSSVFVKMANVKWDVLAKGSLGIAAMAAVLVISANSISTNASQIKKAAWGLITFSTALKLMVKTIEKLGSLDVDVIRNGLVGIGILLAELSLFMNTTKLDGMGIVKGVGIMLLATSLLILAQAVKMFGGVDFIVLAKGLAAIGAAMLVIRSIPGLTSTAIGMGILSVALMGMTVAIKMLDTLNFGQIAKGLLVTAAALSVIGATMQLMPSGAIAKSIGVAIIAASLTMLSKGISSLGSLNLGTIATGLLTLVGALTIITLAMSAMTGTVGGAIAMTIMVMSLNLLAGVLERFGSMELSTIGIGLLALAGVLGVLGVAGLLLAPAVPVLLGLSGAIALLGVGSLALGAGLVLLGTGLAAVAAAGTAAFAVLVSGIKGLLDLIPYLLIKIGEGFIGILQVINENMPLITEVVISAVKGLITAVIALTPMIVAGIISIITALLNTLAEHMPDFIDAGSKLIISIMDGIARNMPGIVNSAVNLITTFLDALSARMPELIDSGLNLIFAFCTGLMEGFARRLPALISATKKVFKQIMEAGKDVIKTTITNFIDLGADLVSGLAKGIKKGLSSVVNAIGDVASAAIKKGKEIFDINSPSRVFREMGMYCDKGLAGGITKYTKVVTSSVGKLGRSTINAIRDIINDIDFSDIDDPNPTITPVLDMSLLNKGMDSMTRLLSNKDLQVATAGFGSLTVDNLDAIKNSRISGLQNDNSDVVSAINDLQRSINNLTPGNSYRLGNITYDDGSNVSNAIETLIRAAKIGRRI